jgi:nicotinamidase-related amidase
MVLEGADDAARKAGQALAWFRAKAWPVCHVRHLNLRPEAGFFLPGTAGVEFHPQVAPAHGEAVIEKNFPNSFRDTSLRDTLQHLGVGALVIAGMMSHMCVDATTRAAFDLGYQCLVLTDACATRDLEFQGRTIPAGHVHAAFMAALGQVYARLALADELETALGAS